MKGDELLSWIQKDIAVYKTEVAEFPITAMSRRLANALEKVFPHVPTKESALDVGSGGGIHSFLFAVRGFGKIHGLERCDVAIHFAKQRAQRLAKALNGSGWIEPEFIHGDVESDLLHPGLLSSYQVMCFNPPSFFSPTPINLKNPLDSGLFTGLPTRDGTTSNPVHNYFTLVDKLLAPGGISASTWPGIQTRQVLDETGIALHPTRMLMKRMGWNIKAANLESAEDFYRFKSQMVYGEGPSVEFNISAKTYRRTQHYSKFIQNSDPDVKWVSSFLFGILILKRDLQDKNVFHLVDLEDL